jgi:beta-lactamase regulating signal transducer with metallopeptidase domain
MKDLLFVFCLALLAFGLLNCLLSFAIALGARWLRFDCRPRERARRYLLVRAFPGAISVLFVGAFFIPVLCRDEPGGPDEQLSVVMCSLATAAVLILAAAIIRALHSIWATWRLSKSWAERARPLELKEFPIPAFLIEAAFPVVAIVGVVRQRLYVARQVLENCSPDEFDAILSHERAHIRHRDNLLRLVLRCFPDLLAATPTARCLERGWARASEEAADDAVAATGKDLVLASALCKVARLARGNLPLPAIALHGDGDIAHRIDRLVRPETRLISSVRGRYDWLRFVVLLAVPIIAASLEQAHLHAVTEALVRLLR